MKTPGLVWLSFFALCLAPLACSAPAEDEDGSGTESGDGDTTTGDGDTTTGDGDGDTTTGDGDGDGGNTGGECIVYQPGDCANPDLKCMPWSAKPDRIPDATKCCPLSNDPVSLGDRCRVQDYDGSCLDDCPADTMCVVDSLEALEGYCHVFCDPGDPVLCEPEELCKPFFEMIELAETVPLCMPRCHPLLQDCESKGRPGWTCLPEGINAPDFLCMPPYSNSPKMEYEGCLLQNDCAVGLACVPASEVIGCTGLFNCCTRYCDTNEAMPCGMGNECISLESAVPGLENVGVCADPV